MAPQVSKRDFIKALSEMGMNPEDYSGKKISLDSAAETYELKKDVLVEAIDRNHIGAFYDYSTDTIMVDALDTAHFFYCVKNEAHLYSR